MRLVTAARLRLVTVVVVSAVASLCLFTAPAWAWIVSTPSASVVRVQREPEDSSGTVLWSIYQAAAVPGSAAYANGTYDATETGGFFSGAASQTISVDATSWAFDYYCGTYSSVLACGPDGRREFITRTYADPVYLSYYGSYQAATSTAVRVVTTATVAVASVPTVSVSTVGTIGAMPSLESSMTTVTISASSTVPVQVIDASGTVLSSGGLNSLPATGAVALGVLVASVIGMVIRRGF